MALRRFAFPVAVALFAITVTGCAVLAIQLHQARVHPAPAVQRTSPDWSAPKSPPQLADSRGPLLDSPEVLTWTLILLGVLAARIVQMRRARRSALARHH